MPARIAAFISHQIEAARDFLSGAVDQGSAAASHWGRDAQRAGRRLGAASMDAIETAQSKLARYGLTPEVVAGLAGPQLRQLQRAAARQARRHPGSIAGSLLVLGAVAAIAYAMARESKLAAPRIIRPRD